MWYEAVPWTFLLRIALAMSAALAGIVAISWSAAQSDVLRTIALIEMGPMVMASGYFVDSLRPDSKLGLTLTLCGFNFACGFPLLSFYPANFSFRAPGVTDGMLMVAVLFILLNSWQTLYFLDKDFQYARIHKLPRRWKSTQN
jgi:hypothetical protein